DAECATQVTVVEYPPNEEESRNVVDGDVREHAVEQPHALLREGQRRGLFRAEPRNAIAGAGALEQTPLHVGAGACSHQEAWSGVASSASADESSAATIASASVATVGASKMLCSSMSAIVFRMRMTACVARSE